MKLLLVGDPHVTVEELADCQALMDLVLRVAVETSPDYVVFMGDQHHNHAIVRVEVLDFWQRALEQFKACGVPVIMLVGNHDRSNDTALTANSLAYQSDNCMVVDAAFYMRDVSFISWTPTGDEFLKLARGSTNIICHHTFDGSHYENGFYAPDGIKLDTLLDVKSIISGHIHTPQEYGKVWYPGAPRWRTATDANIPRNIWLVELDRNGIVSRTPFSTNGVCKSLYHVDDYEGQLLFPPETTPPCRLTVNIYGSEGYIVQQNAFWRARGARISTFPTKVVRGEVRESEGVAKALQRHVEGFKPKYGTPTPVLQKMVQERIYVN